MASLSQATTTAAQQQQQQQHTPENKEAVHRAGGCLLLLGSLAFESDGGGGGMAPHVSSVVTAAVLAMHYMPHLRRIGMQLVSKLAGTAAAAAAAAGEGAAEAAAGCPLLHSVCACFASPSTGLRAMLLTCLAAPAPAPAAGRPSAAVSAGRAGGVRTQVAACEAVAAIFGSAVFAVRAVQMLLDACVPSRIYF
jgi:hypothetical protein